MTTDYILLAISVIFTLVMITGVAIQAMLARRRETRRRESRRAWLSREAPDCMTVAGPYLSVLYVRRPGDDAPRDPDDDPAAYSGPYRDPWA
jgi:hypothetical protein